MMTSASWHPQSMRLPPTPIPSIGAANLVGAELLLEVVVGGVVKQRLAQGVDLERLVLQLGDQVEDLRGGREGGGGCTGRV